MDILIVSSLFACIGFLFGWQLGRGLIWDDIRTVRHFCLMGKTIWIDRVEDYEN